jgi:hypothetical protein
MQNANNYVNWKTKQKLHKCMLNESRRSWYARWKIPWHCPFKAIRRAWEASIEIQEGEKKRRLGGFSDSSMYSPLTRALQLSHFQLGSNKDSVKKDASQFAREILIGTVRRDLRRVSSDINRSGIPKRNHRYAFLLHFLRPPSWTLHKTVQHKLIRNY